MKTISGICRMSAAILYMIAVIVSTSCMSPVMYGHSDDALADLPTVSSIDEAWRISASMRYDGSWDCKTPAKTYADKSGDCKDIGALLVALLHSIDVDAILVRIHYGDAEHIIVYSSEVGYMEAHVYGWIYSVDELDIMTTYTLDEYLGGVM